MSIRRSILVILFAAVVFLVGITWGLPSDETNAFLFGRHTPWDGQTLVALAGEVQSETRVGADVDRNPLDRSAGETVLNVTDAQRAEIVRRYRLFSYQPDEFITFKALAEMAGRSGPGKADPRLYQYGGLWIYPIGVTLRVAAGVGLIELGGQAYALDHPDSFGRFYVVARLYSVMWGLLAVWTMMQLASALARDDRQAKTFSAVAGVSFALLPVVVTMAHEAKPHLAGATLTLLTVLAGVRFVHAGTRRASIIAGLAAGAATGMVLTGVWAFAVLPVMVWLRHGRSIKPVFVTLCLSTFAGLLTYAVTNPFVLINAGWHPELLGSNVGNSTAMYGVRDLPAAAINAAWLFGSAISWPCAAAMVFIGTWAIVRKTRPTGSPAMLLLSAPAILTLLQFILLAAGKPGEYARFAIVPAAAAVLLCLAVWPRAWPAAAWALPACLLPTALLYLHAFAADAYNIGSSRTELAAVLAESSADLELVAEPAPYAAPAMNLFDRRLILVKPGSSVDAGRIRLTASDDPLTPITWANKPLALQPAVDSGEVNHGDPLFRGGRSD